jgi:lysine N6-hydroxylase
MQPEFYRDLVTPIDPTSRFSFLNYLKLNDRLDQFFCSEYICPTRLEFEDYFNWVARETPDVIFGAKVTAVDYAPGSNLFVLETERDERDRFTARHIVFGCGQSPDSAVAKSEGRRVTHVSSLLAFELPESLQSILVVGGGQSAAECLNYLLDKYARDRIQITWLTHETSFRALDKGNFSREAYSVSYGPAFADLPASLREKINRDESHIVDGITPEVAKALYQRLYSLKFFPPETSPSVRLHANIEVVEIGDNPDKARVTTRAMATGKMSVDRYDSVILCTGFEEESVFESPIIGPELSSRISDKDACDGYAVKWNGPEDRMIFVQSQNKKTHGLGDANFIAAPGRNAAILNSILGRELYKVSDRDLLVAT